MLRKLIYTVIGTCLLCSIVVNPLKANAKERKIVDPPNGSAIAAIDCSLQKVGIAQATYWIGDIAVVGKTWFKNTSYKTEHGYRNLIIDSRPFEETKRLAKPLPIEEAERRPKVTYPKPSKLEQTQIRIIWMASSEFLPTSIRFVPKTCNGRALTGSLFINGQSLEITAKRRISSGPRTKLGPLLFKYDSVIDKYPNSNWTRFPSSLRITWRGPSGSRPSRLNVQFKNPLFERTKADSKLKSQSKKLEAIINSAESLMKEGDFGTANGILSRTMKSAKSLDGLPYDKVLKLQGFCHLKLCGGYDVGMCWRKSLTLNPNQPDLWLELARYQQTKSDYSGALKSLNQYLKGSPDKNDSRYSEVQSQIQNVKGKLK